MSLRLNSTAPDLKSLNSTATSWTAAHLRIAHEHSNVNVLPCRKFPWDKQQLLIQMKYDHDTIMLKTTSKMVPSASLRTSKVCTVRA